jgi:hypothetical protein
VKTDRLSVIRVLAVLLAILAVGQSAGRTQVGYKFGKDHQVTLGTGIKAGAATVLAGALAKQARQVHDRFITKRKALRPLNGPGNATGFLANEVTGLISDAHQDLDQAIQNVRPSGTEPLRAWVNFQFGKIQGKAPLPGATASRSGYFAPRTGVALASLRGGGMALTAKPKPKKRTSPKPQPAPPEAASPPQPQTIPIATADRLLDQVEEVISRIFTLADHNDLEVSLWVGSTSAKAKLKFWQGAHGTFRFWPEGRIRGATPSPTIIPMSGKRDHVLRGLYSYEADLGLEKGAVVQTIKYPNSASPLESERLDLVNGSPFFCCRFNEDYCRHVDRENDCR